MKFVLSKQTQRTLDLPGATAWQAPQTLTVLNPECLSDIHKSDQTKNPCLYRFILQEKNLYLPVYISHVKY